MGKEFERFRKMETIYGLSVKIFLTVAIFATGVFSMDNSTDLTLSGLQPVQINITVNATLTNNTTANHNETLPKAVSNDKVIDSTTPASNVTEAVKSNVQEKQKSVMPAFVDHRTTIEITTAASTMASVDKKSTKTSASGEQKDLIESHVTPHDDDDTTVAMTTETTQPKAISSTSTTVNILDDLSSNPPKIFPQGKGVEEISHANADTIARFNRTMYHTVNGTDMPPPMEKDVHLLPEAKANKTGTITTNSTSEIVQQTHALELESSGKPVKSENAGEDNRMSSGAIALVAAAVCGVVLITVYLGLIVWRRYVEYRYGHRELLVNELEFDINDLRHFEL